MSNNKQEKTGVHCQITHVIVSLVEPANILLAYKQDKRSVPSSSLPTRDGSVCDNFVYGRYVAKISKSSARALSMI